MLQRRALRWRAIVAAVVAVSLVAFCCWLFTGWATDNTKNSALKETEQLLRSAGSHPIGALPKDDIPSYLWVGEECWSFLQEALKSSGQHTTTVTYYNQDDPKYNFRDVDEVFLRVDFADKPSAFVRYYEGGIQDCAPMKPSY